MRARAVHLRAACGVLVQRSPTSCGARLHRAALVDVADTTYALTHSQSHRIALACLYAFARGCCLDPQRPLMPQHGVPSCLCTCICRAPCP